MVAVARPAARLSRDVERVRVRAEHLIRPDQALVQLCARPRSFEDPETRAGPLTKTKAYTLQLQNP